MSLGRGGRSESIRAVCLAAVILFAGTFALARSVLAASVTEAPKPYAIQLIERAREAHLAEDPTWLALGHYSLDWIGPGRTGLIDNPGYFLSPTGKTDPEAELEATLIAFFQLVPETGSDDHPQCLKISRYRWLKQQLDFDPARLPQVPCPKFEKWFHVLNAARVTFIFPAAYLNNPSSSFGHTLIRLDPPPTSGATALTSFTIHFSADNLGQGGIPFIFNGLGGGYKGYFSVLPYYKKVSQYSDIENRDIWEYGLNFTPNQIARMLQNLWEMEGQWIDYYFFTTNCSYALLSLLDTARPDLHLTDQFMLDAVPVDTIRALVDVPGVLGATTFRPSSRTRIRRMQEKLSPASQSLALRLAKGEEAIDSARVQALPIAEHALVLDVAQSYLQYQRETGAISREEMADRSLALLRARSHIPAAAVHADPSMAESPENERPTFERPDTGHDTVRVAAMVGATGEHPYIELRGRPVYHDSLDPPIGHVPGAAIEMADLRLRYYPGEIPTVESFTLIGIESLTPRDELFRPLSWSVRLGMDRFRKDGGDVGEPVGLLTASGGHAWTPFDGTIFAILPELALYGEGDWPDRRIGGAGLHSVFLWPGLSWGPLRLEAGWQYAAGTHTGDQMFQANVGQGFTLNRDLEWRVEAGLRNDGDETYGVFSTGLQWYF